MATDKPWGLDNVRLAVAMVLDKKVKCFAKKKKAKLLPLKHSKNDKKYIEFHFPFSSRILGKLLGSQDEMEESACGWWNIIFIGIFRAYNSLHGLLFFFSVRRGLKDLFPLYYVIVYDY